MTTVAEATAPAATRLDRVLAAIPLASIFTWLCLVYGWQAWGHGTPWLFTDELEFSQLSRAIAATGHAARRGEPHGFNSLYTLLIAPAWRISDTGTAYSVIKYLGVLVMTSSLFPAYALARLVVSSRAALFVAAGTAAIPSLAYSSLVIEEPLAYPYATLCFFLITKALVVRSRSWIAGAVVASLVAPLIRTELALIPAVAVVAALLVFWSGERMRHWRSDWSRWDWTGAVLLAIGALFFLGGLARHESTEWSVATRYKDRMLDYGLWAGGSLTIGLGVLPVVAGLSFLFRPREEPPTPATTAFRSMLGTAVVAFALYTATKAAYLSTVFATRVEERNLIYLSPLLLVGTALVLERRRVRLTALAAAAGLALAMILVTPYQLAFHPYADAFGLAILSGANRSLAWTDSTAETVLLAMLAVSVAVLAAATLLRGRERAVSAALALVALLVVGWSLTGEISAASGSNDFSKRLLAHIPGPTDWVDQVTHGKPAVYLGQQIADPDGVWLLEFWNRSVQRVWSLDGTGPGPGPTLTPDIVAVNGTLRPQTGFRYAVADAGVQLVGTPVARNGSLQLYRVAPPLRLRSAATGIFSDGWTGSDSGYSQFSGLGGKGAAADVTVSRIAACGRGRPAAHVRVTVGTLALGRYHQATIGRTTAVRRSTIRACNADEFFIPTPPPPFRVQVHIEPTFSPADYGSSDRRQLGAQVGYRILPRAALG